MGKTYRHGGEFGPRRKKKGGSAKRNARPKTPKKSKNSDYNRGDSSAPKRTDFK
tara:strand:- start:14 stop:175 length:162 start_codon:yes stop_codon:yes gene_type:complete